MLQVSFTSIILLTHKMSEPEGALGIITPAIFKLSLSDGLFFLLSETFLQKLYIQSRQEALLWLRWGDAELKSLLLGLPFVFRGR